MPVTNYGPYGVSLLYRVSVGHSQDLKDAVKSHAGSLKGQSNGLHFVTYRNFIGPKRLYHIFLPLEKFGELDNWPKRAGAEDVIAPAVVGKETRFLELVPDLSTASPSSPSKYAFVISFSLKPGASSGAVDVGRNFLGSNASPKVLTYRTFVGLKDAYHVCVPFDSFSEIDGWRTGNPPNYEGDSVLGVSVFLGEYVPDLSNPV